MFVVVVGEPDLRQCAVNQTGRRRQLHRLVTRDGDLLKRRGRRRLKAGGLSFQTPPVSSSAEVTTRSYVVFDQHHKLWHGDLKVRAALEVASGRQNGRLIPTGESDCQANPNCDANFTDLYFEMMFSSDDEAGVI